MNFCSSSAHCSKGVGSACPSIHSLYGNKARRGGEVADPGPHPRAV